MSDIVEWLREMQDEYAPGGGGVQYHERYKEAADRIEGLEAENGALIALRDAREIFITSLASRLRGAEAALREIVAVGKKKHLYQCEQDEDMAAIARKALGEEKP